MSLHSTAAAITKHKMTPREKQHPGKHRENVKNDYPTNNVNNNLF